MRVRVIDDGMKDQLTIPDNQPYQFEKLKPDKIKFIKNFTND